MIHPRIFDEEKVNEKIREWMELKRDANYKGNADDVCTYNVYIDAFQMIRKMHGLKALTEDRHA